MSTIGLPRAIFPKRAAQLAVCLCAALCAAAQADGGRRMPAQVPGAYTQECGSCHLAYPPGLLPAASWQRLMQGLGRHFGSDAGVDPATLRELGGWLQAHAATGRREGVAPPQDRITRSDWFLRKHRRIDPALWRHDAVRSPAQCEACHPAAPQGRFDDDEVRLPAGPVARPARPARPGASTQ